MLQVYVTLTETIRRGLRGLQTDEHGQSMIEYGLLAALIGVAVIAAVTLLGGNLKAYFNNIAGNF